MSVFALILVPLVASLSLLAPGVRARASLLLVGVAALVSVLAVRLAVGSDGAVLLAGFVRVDATSRLFLAVVNPIFFGISIYVWNRVTMAPSLRDGMGRFVALALGFLAAANAVLVANHLLAAWIALEATTLAAAPLIVRPGMSASRQASWRYLLFSSVGLGLALLGFMCVARGVQVGAHAEGVLLDHATASASGASSLWRRLGLSLLLLGFGTKLGLAPMYSWLPEAYDEAPPAVTALLAAVQFNCALVLLLRVLQSYRASEPKLVAAVLVAMGLISMVVSTFNIIASRNIKRLLAYASINHAGVIAIGLGLGKTASYGLLLYLLSNAFIKAVLFLTAGKIKAHYRTKDTRRISGLIKDLPYSGMFLMVGTFALLGFPPFGSFFGELLILSALVSSGRFLVFAAFCVLITMSFVATGRTIFPMIWGEAKEKHDWPRQTLLSASPKIAFVVALVVLGLYVPPVAQALIERVAASVEGP
ncbi:MAG TPA: proton-conducting transporter membrane subunit [Polyangiales bacterium]